MGDSTTGGDGGGEGRAMVELENHNRGKGFSECEGGARVSSQSKVSRGRNTLHTLLRALS